MEIVQISIPDIPDLKGLFAKAVEVPDVKMGGIIEFIKENWVGLLLVAAVIGGLIYIFFNSPKVENDKPNEVPQATPFNQPITYIQRPNDNDRQ